MKSTIIRCNCGHRIVAKDVLQRSWYVRVFGPSFMYLKYRCSRCKRLGEKFIEQDKWDDSILRDIPSEASTDERKRFDRLGKITVDEEIDFHFALDQPRTLAELRDEESAREERPKEERSAEERPRGEGRVKGPERPKKKS